MAFSIDLSGKNILVTGASRGIGRSIALLLGKAGARVAVHYGRNVDAANSVASEIGNGSFAIGADLGTSEACLNLFAGVVEEMGTVDALVNNAGIAIDADADGSDEAWISAWDQQMNVNARASAVLALKAVQHFSAQRGGRIVFISSRAAFRGDTADAWAYAASKSAIIGLNGSIARAYGKRGIKSFLIAPGWTLTEMAQAYIDEHGDARVLGEIALDRLTGPDDIAPMVALLVSGMADHATGTSIDMNAGSYVH